ncbi:hypothetical protein TWF106_010678 [Orbilia oligospora]|uniref:Uncharacterized protein n=1 Tax=Orbilia oligospora TaxID=2813651 RepID=A0A7C8QG25_ORBOL|nr:hypothetical protein TWF106_010678 [Orbilia oligospora]
MIGTKGSLKSLFSQLLMFFSLGEWSLHAVDFTFDDNGLGIVKVNRDGSVVGENQLKKQDWKPKCERKTEHQIIDIQIPGIPRSLSCPMDTVGDDHRSPPWKFRRADWTFPSEG